MIQSEDHEFKTTFERLPIGAGHVALDGRWLLVNAKLLQLTGLTAAEMLGGLRFHDCIHPEEFHSIARFFQDLALDASREYSGEHRCVRKNGDVIPVTLFASAVADSDGRPRYVLATFQEMPDPGTQKGPQENREQLDLLFGGASAGIWEWNIEADEIHYGSRIRELLGLPRDRSPIKAEEFLSRVHPQDQRRMRSVIEAHLNARLPYDVEYRLRTSTGEYRWFNARGQALWDGKGQPYRMAGFICDITRQKNTEETLRRSEERMRLLSKAANVVFWDWDLITNELWWNELFEKVFGADPSDSTIDSWTRQIHPNDRERVLRGIDAVLQGEGESWSDEYRFLARDGTSKYVVDRGYVVRDQTGAAVRMMGGMTDLTDRKAAEEKIAEQAALLDHATNAILVKDLEDHILFWNKGAEVLYGWARGDALGRTSCDLFIKEPAKYREARRLLMEKGEWHGEMAVKTRDGRELTVEFHWSVVKDPEGRPKSILAINSDITEKKRLEAQFLRAQRMESIGTLASGIAHDLNNVLSPIVMSIEMLRMKIGDPEGEEMLSTLAESSQRGADLVRQVLSFGRGIEGQRIPVNLRHIAREIQRIVRDTFPKYIRFELSVSSELWVVSGDPTQLHQVLMNLCVNARDAMPAGGTLSIALENFVADELYAGMNPESRPGEYVIVTVTDTGAGIPPEIRDKIFDPFFTTKEVGKGTGLGLSTSLAIVKSHNGFIHVLAGSNGGAVFKVYLPAEPSQQAVAEGDSEHIAFPQGRGEWILVVDDEANIRTITKKTLERFGYHVLLASNGAEAVSIYAQHRDRVAAVITDMAMPVMDGPATILALRAINPAIKVIGSSGLALDKNSARPIGAALQYSMPKPYRADVMLRILAKVLRFQDHPPGQSPG